MKYLCGEAYRLMCDVTYQPGMLIEKDGQSVFCHSLYREQFLTEGHNKKRCVLVTHESDWAVDQRMVDMMPENIVRWFGVNVVVDHPKIEAIPLGIGSPWYPHGDQAKLEELAGSSRIVDNLAIAFYALNTNMEERGPLTAAINHRPWCSNHVYFNHTQRPMEFGEYLTLLRKHVFVLSPPGNGIDCHRIWEALYLGLFPVCKINPALMSFGMLPILFVENWSQVTFGSLMNGFNAISLSKFDTSKLYTAYWKSAIEHYKGTCIG